MSAAKSQFPQPHSLQLKSAKIIKQLETLQLFGLLISAFIALNGIFLISETIGITLLVMGIFGGFFAYLFTKGWIAVINLLMQIEINTRP